jgi:hypothetical protein
MPSVTGLGLTFNLPNYTGEVLTVTPSDTPFLSAIGGLNEQGEVVSSTRFEGQTQDLGTPSQPDGILEGADAPTLNNRSRGTWNNVTQIFHYAFGISYTRQAATQQLAGLANGRMNPVTDEIGYQSNLKLTDAARDLNHTFLNGVYQLPVDNTTGRKTRGLYAAISTNALSNLATALTGVAGAAATDLFTKNGHGYTDGQQVRVSAVAGGLAGIAAGVYWVVSATANTFALSLTEGGAAIDLTVDGTCSTQLLAPLTAARVLDMIQTVWTSYGVNTAAEPTLLCGARIKRALTKLFITDRLYQEQSRTVGGVSVTRLETDFGPINLMLERANPANTLGFAHLGVCKPAYMMIPEKGFLFVEELAKTGAQRKFQLYGEAGFWHGPEQAHAKIADVGFVANA